MCESLYTIELSCRGLEPGLCDRVLPLLKSAASSLDLDADFFFLEVMADDDSAASGEVNEPWLRLVKSPEPHEERLAGTLFCSRECFCQSFSRNNGVFPAVEVWDQAPAPRGNECPEVGEFSVSNSASFLHHELLLAQDLAREELDPTLIPANLIEAFAAAWAVVVDGRLSRKGLPGYEMAQRRSRFSRLFSSAGVLLPNHWQIFQTLWDGGVSDGEGVLASIRLLPPL